MHKELRLFVLVPIAINVVFFVILTSLLFSYFDKLIQWNMPNEGWWRFLAAVQGALEWMLGFIVATVLIITYGYFFNIITGLLAAPFYGLLAERTEVLLTGEEVESESLIAMIPRTFFRELQKLLYLAIRTPIIFLLGIMLGASGILAFCAPLLGAAWGAWSMAIQYADYPADNHRLGFRRLRKRLRRRSYSSLGFGGMVMLGSMIPIINIIIMPAAVTGGTLYWVRELKHLEPGRR